MYSETIIDRGVDTRCTFFDQDWTPQDARITYDFAKREIAKPKCMDLMLQISCEFYADMGYVRVDFYLQNDEILHIGELTLTPGGGCLPIRPRIWDEKLGECWA